MVSIVMNSCLEDANYLMPIECEKSSQNAHKRLVSLLQKRVKQFCRGITSSCAWCYGSVWVVDIIRNRQTLVNIMDQHIKVDRHISTRLLWFVVIVCGGSLYVWIIDQSYIKQGMSLLIESFNSITIYINNCKANACMSNHMLKKQWMHSCIRVRAKAFSESILVDS